MFIYKISNLSFIPQL